MKLLQIFFMIVASQRKNNKSNAVNTVHENYCDYFDLDCETSDDSAANRVARQICCEGTNESGRVFDTQ
jgi:hypothetical protein